MAKWRAVADYSAFARALVEYMWNERPPLVPNQFADRFGVRKQAVSTWLNSDAVPAPPVVVRLARGMGLPVRALLVAAGYAAGEDPLLDLADAWTSVLDTVEQALAAGEGDRAGEEDGMGRETSEGVGITAECGAAALDLLRRLRDRALASRP